MKISLYPHGGCKTMPWKNGGGVTEELFIYPADATLAEGNFEVRLSSATVSRGGPFSTFEGISRYLGLISGQPLELTVEGRHRQLAVGDEPYFFEGEWAVSCDDPSAPQKDINLFIRREQWYVQVLQQTGPVDVGPRDLTLILPLDGSAELTLGDQVFGLKTLDLWVGEGAGDVIHLDSAGRTWVVLLSRR